MTTYRIKPLVWEDYELGIFAGAPRGTYSVTAKNIFFCGYKIGRCSSIEDGK